MGQKLDFQNREALFSRRVEVDLLSKILEIHELRERVRLAEMAAKSGRIACRPERPVYASQDRPATKQGVPVSNRAEAP